MTRRTVRNGGADLAVFEQNAGTKPTVLLVHGYPDTHRVWDELADLLAERFHVVRYDTRGVGASTAPSGPGAFHLDELAADLGAVAHAVSPDEPVHLIGHDWGAFQCWAACAAPALQGRIASYTAVAGPRLDDASSMLEGLTLRRALAIARQARRSAYIALAQIPRLPEAMMRRSLADRWPDAMRRREGIEPREGHPAATLVDDAVAGLALYRTNMSLRRPPAVPVDVPVQLLVPTEDRYITPFVYEHAERWAVRLWRRDLRAGHWVQRSHPADVARAGSELIDHVEGAPEEPALRRARCDASPSPAP